MKRAIGFERESDQMGGRRFCLDLMAWMLLDGHGTVDTYRDVMAGRMPCPARRTCERYVKGKAAGKQFAWPGQISLAIMVTD